MRKVYIAAAYAILEAAEQNETIDEDAWRKVYSFLKAFASADVEYHGFEVKVSIGKNEIIKSL